MRALAWTRTQQKAGSAAVPQSPDFRVMRSVAEKQPQQNDHRNRHAKQPKQNSSSHHLLLTHRGENARCRGQFLRGKEASAKERFMVLEFPRATSRWLGWRTCTKKLYKAYQWPVFGIEDHGSAGGFGSPFCNSSIECRSGERTKAMLPSRGGRLMVMPAFIRWSQVA